MGQGPAPAVSMAEATLVRVWREEGLVCGPVLCHLAAQLLLAPFIYMVSLFSKILTVKLRDQISHPHGNAASQLKTSGRSPVFA